MKKVMLYFKNMARSPEEGWVPADEPWPTAALGNERNSFQFLRLAHTESPKTKYTYISVSDISMMVEQ